MRKIKKRNINLYSRYNKSFNVSLKTDPVKRIYILCTAGVVILMTVTYIFLRLQLNSVRLEHDELSQKIYSDKAQEQADQIVRLSNENILFDLISDKHNENVTGIETSHKLISDIDPEFIDKILSCQGTDVQISKIMFEEKILSVSCLALKPDQASEFVAKLDEKNIFSRISYSGFNVEGDKYSFTVTAVF